MSARPSRVATTHESRASTPRRPRTLARDTPAARTIRTIMTGPFSEDAGGAVSTPGELEVRHIGSGDRPHEIEAVQVVIQALEQPLTATEKDRYEADFHLVDETGHEILLRGLRAAGERHILPTRRAPCLL